MVWLLLACGTSGGRIEASPRDRVEAGPYAVTVERGSRVRHVDGGIAVDAPDGRRWFDVVWGDGDPQAFADAWGAEACEPVLWDEAVQGGRWWARGGMCTVKDRRHWALVLVRPAEGGRIVRTTYVADHAFVPYEDAWVDFVGTALTVGVGDPVGIASPAEVRDHVRSGTAKGTGPWPIPGGGLISTRVHTEMASRYDGMAVLPERGPPGQ